MSCNHEILSRVATHRAVHVGRIDTMAPLPIGILDLGLSRNEYIMQRLGVSGVVVCLH